MNPTPRPLWLAPLLLAGSVACTGPRTVSSAGQASVGVGLGRGDVAPVAQVDWHVRSVPTIATVPELGELGSLDEAPGLALR